MIEAVEIAHGIFIVAIQLLAPVWMTLLFGLQTARTFYLRMAFLLVSQWVLLDGRCLVTMYERQHRDNDNGGLTLSEFWNHLSRLTGLEPLTLAIMSFLVTTLWVIALGFLGQPRPDDMYTATATLLLIGVTASQWRRRHSECA